MARIKPGPPSNRKSGMPPREYQRREVVIAADGERFGVFDSTKVYTQHAVARILGYMNSTNGCPRYIADHFLRGGVPYMRVGRTYLMSGHHLQRWVEANALTWDEHERVKEEFENAASQQR